MTILDSNKLHQFYFEELTKIPHGSYDEKRISDYLVSFAKEQGLDYYQDHVHNVVIYKPASAGYEDHAPVMLQAHMDMVCEKDSGVDHDFEKDALSLYIEDGWLHAKGTTLGGDDGAGVAYMMAMLANKELAHPALECLFTVQEECTMEGAVQMDVSKLSARRLINIDGEEENCTMTSSCGGVDFHIGKEVVFEPILKKGYSLKVSGLMGGHSGGDIHKERGNSIQIISRMLYKLGSETKVCLGSLVGGSKVNAIPREAEAIFTSETNPVELLNQEGQEILKELEFSDAGFKWEISECDVAEVMSEEESKKVLSFIYVMPNGMLHKCEEQDNLTVSSSNVGIIHVQEGKILIEGSCRGGLKSYYMDTFTKLEALASVYGYEAKSENGYPCWDFMPHSPLRDTMAKVHEEVYGKEIAMFGVHGGLECGIFKEKLPDLDIVTMGPNIQDVHSPSEKMELASFDSTFEFLVKFVEAL